MELLIGWLFFSVAVGILAGRRGRSSGGWCLLALFISPLIAVVLLLCFRDLKAEEQETYRNSVIVQQMRVQQQQLHELRRLQPNVGRVDSDVPPPGGYRRFRIAKNGSELGIYTVQEIRRKLASGEIVWEDYYWDTPANAWLELVCISSLIQEH
jgi:hypothetical protein